MKTTGERIRELRLSLGLTQEELGAKVGVKKAAINKYETGLVINLKRSILSALADVLHTTPTYLMGYDDIVSSGDRPDEDGLSPDESALVATYRTLNPTGQEVLRTTAQSLALNPDMAAQSPLSPPADRLA